MINKSVFKISIDESIKHLKGINLFKDIGPNQIGCYSKEFKKVCRGNKHIDIYNCIVKNLDYEIILNDDSFFQFSWDNEYLRYSFIQNPNISFSKTDYLNQVFSLEEIDEMSDSDLDELVNEDDYEQFLNEQIQNNNPIYIRYDFDRKGYKPLLHSCSHIHFTLSEDMRISSQRIFTPHMFTYLCVKLCYYDSWKSHFELKEQNAIASEILDIKNRAFLISDKDIWNDIEKNEMYLF